MPRGLGRGYLVIATAEKSARMAFTTDRLLEEVLKLPPDERARIVVELLASLEPDLPSRRRDDEIERRARAAFAGRGASWPEARDQIQSRLSSQ